LKKIFFDPSYVPMRFFRQGERAIEKFFLLVLHFLHQNETTAG
jgi:hypothetical protein